MELAGDTELSQDTNDQWIIVVHARGERKFQVMAVEWTVGDPGLTFVATLHKKPNVADEQSVREWLNLLLARHGSAAVGAVIGNITGADSENVIRQRGTV